MLESAILTAGVSVIVLVAVTVLLLRRRGLSKKGADDMRLAVAEGQHIPPSLHPVIDANLCIGSFSCIKACPEGDIIGVIDGVATLVEAAHCIGHGRCATDCPVGAIRLVYGTAEKGIDLPETDDGFESTRPGVFIVGELGGMGLIKNALRQGLAVGTSLKSKLRKSEADGDRVDVVIVGGGPAGIAAAVACKQQGLVARVLEQESLGGCIAHYPRGKVVMSEQVDLPFYGRFGRALLSKEDLLHELQSVLEKSGVTIEEGQKVVGISGNSGDFTVATASGTQVRARAVVLATGLRGSPRKLGAPGEDNNKVAYRLVDPTQFHGKRVLVVGGGDSAIEAAIQLAEESTAWVSISYRQDSFHRAKARNRERIAELIAEKRVRAFLSTEVIQIDDKSARLRMDSGQTGSMKNDAVIVSVGGELPTAFLNACGVAIRRYTGQEKGAGSGPARGLTKAEVETKTRRRLAIGLFALGSAILAGLFLIGADYYMEPADERHAFRDHDLLKPAGVWGHTIGVVATVFMLATFIYPLRKRWSALKGTATIRSWLTFHIFVGVMSPLIAAFHAAFLMNNLLALWTWVALAVVVGTGSFGRFLFGFVPARAGKVLELTEVRAQISEVERALEPRITETTNVIALRELLARVNTPLAPTSKAAETSLWQVIVKARASERTLAATIERARGFFPDAHGFSSFHDGVLALARGRVQEAFYKKLKRLFRVWLVIHVVLAVFMVVLITAHIGVALWLGFAPGNT